MFATVVDQLKAFFMAPPVGRPHLVDGLIIDQRNGKTYKTTPGTAACIFSNLDILRACLCPGATFIPQEEQFFVTVREGASAPRTVPVTFEHIAYLIPSLEHAIARNGVVTTIPGVTNPLPPPLPKSG